jgi:membrane protein
MVVNLPRTWSIIKEAAAAWQEVKAPRLGAALAYYAIFSLAPLVLIAVAVAGLVFGAEAARDQLFDQLQDFLGTEGASAVQTMLAGAANPSSGILALCIGAGTLLLAAAGFFGQLQDALNTIWEVQPLPGHAIRNLVKNRLLTFLMVLGTAFVLLGSLILSTMIAAFQNGLGLGQSGALGQVVHFVVSFSICTALFAMVYKFLPDIVLAWKEVWYGAAVTAFLFNVGKLLIGLYLGHSAVSSTYGAAGSLVVLLIWFYYSAQIFLFGAELTKAYANQLGSGIVPADHAYRVTEMSRAGEGTVRTSADNGNVSSRPGKWERVTS